jgi:hypothetical protein
MRKKIISSIKKPAKDQNGFSKAKTLLYIIGVVLVSAGAIFYTFKHVNAAEVTIDGTISTVTQTHSAVDSKIVFTSDLVGYIFYRDSGGTIVYSKTTDGGATWGAAVTVNNVNTHIERVSVWYDRWTPGNTTGNIIHIVSRDSNNGTSDVYYREFDASSDTFPAATINLTDASGLNKTNDYTATDINFISISASTAGVNYIAASDGNQTGDQSFILKCSSSCTTVANWSDTSAPIGDWTTGCTSCNTNEFSIEPLSGGNMLYTQFNETAGNYNPSTTNTFASKVYNSGTGLWDRDWTIIDSSAPHNGGSTGYDGSWSTVADKLTGVIYLVYAANNNSLGGGNDEIRTAIYKGGVWSSKTKALSGESRGLTQAKVSIDDGTGNIYCVYSMRATAGTATTGEVYWDKSTDGMLTWGAEQGPINANPSGYDLMALTVNPVSNERIYAAWNNKTSNSLVGALVIDLTSSANHAPDAPVLSNPASGAKTSTLPDFRMQARDGDGDYLRYKIEICGDSACTSILQTITQPSGSPQNGWVDQDAQSNTAYNGSRPYYLSSMAVYFTQSQLSVNTQYWWRAYAIDPGGGNTFSAASSISTFTTAATELQIKGGTTIQGGTTL